MKFFDGCIQLAYVIPCRHELAGEVKQLLFGVLFVGRKLKVFLHQGLRQHHIIFFALGELLGLS